MSGKRDACARVQPELEPWLRDDLDDAEADAVERHVARCASCAGEVEWLRPLVVDLEAWGADTYAEGVADRVLARAASESADSAPSAPALGGLIALMLVCLGVVGLALGLSGTRPQPVPTPQAVTPSPSPSPTPTPTPSPPPPPTPTPSPPPPPTPTPTSTPTPTPPPPPPPVDSPPPPEDEPVDVVVEAPAPVPVPAAPPRVEPGPIVDAPPTVTPATREALATLRHGEARVRRGGRAWSDLQVGEVLSAGDALEAEGPVVLALSTITPADPGTFDVGDRVVFAPGAKATLASDALQVDAGAVFVSAWRRVAVRAGACVVHVSAGDAEVSLRSGAVTVVARAGLVELEGRDERRVLAVGQRAAIDRRGRLGASASAREPVPPWAAALAGWSRALAAYPARQGTPPLVALVGTAAGADGLVGVTRPATGPNTQVVCWGDADPARAIAALRPGMTLSFEYRLSASVPLGVQVTDVTQDRNYQGVLTTPRAGAWTWVHARLEGLEDEAKQGATLAVGDLLEFMTISAHGDAPGVVLEVREARLE